MKGSALLTGKMINLKARFPCRQTYITNTFVDEKKLVFYNLIWFVFQTFFKNIKRRSAINQTGRLALVITTYLRIRKLPNRDFPKIFGTNLSYVPFDLFCFWVSHWIVKACKAYPEPVKTIVWSVNSEDRCPGIRLRHPAVSFKYDDLGPDFIVNGLPLIKHFLNVILKQKEMFKNMFRWAAPWGCQAKINSS